MGSKILTSRIREASRSTRIWNREPTIWTAKRIRNDAPKKCDETPDGTGGVGENCVFLRGADACEMKRLQRSVLRGGGSGLRSGRTVAANARGDSVYGDSDAKLPRIWISLMVFDPWISYQMETLSDQIDREIRRRYAGLSQWLHWLAGRTAICRMTRNRQTHK